MSSTEAPDATTHDAAPEYDLTAVVVPLLKTVLYRDDNVALWAALLGLQARVRDYVAVLGLDLTLDEAEGYAFLRGRAGADPDDDAPRLPRLIARRPLGFQVSLLLALLRKKLAEFDASGGDTRLILSRDQVVELIRVFLPAGSNESRLIDQVETHLNKVIELGFVRRLKPQGSGAPGSHAAVCGGSGRCVSHAAQCRLHATAWLYCRGFGLSSPRTGSTTTCCAIPTCSAPVGSRLACRSTGSTGAITIWW